jgi:hypothetical protein
MYIDDVDAGTADRRVFGAIGLYLQFAAQHCCFERKEATTSGYPAMADEK